MRTPPVYRPTTMARFSSLVAIAAVATVTSDALVPGADAARLGTWMMSSELPSAPRLRRPLAALAHRVARH